MTKKTTLVDLLDAWWQRQGALLMMQVDIDAGDFDYAMETQFEYLYWSDEWARLYNEHEKEYWQLKEAADEQTWRM